jgi:hypothetical protein
MDIVPGGGGCELNFAVDGQQDAYVPAGGARQGCAGAVPVVDDVQISHLKHCDIP